MVSIFDNYSKKQLENVLSNNNTWSGILRELGSYDKHQKMLPILRRRLDDLNIDYSFMNSVPIARKEGHSRNKYTKYTDEEIFRRNNEVSVQTVRRAFKEHIEIPYECAICHLPPIWQGKPLVLTMDHIDGDTNNNEFTNFRWVCPNCDRQLPTYTNRNRKRSSSRPLIPIEDRKSGKNICPYCGHEKEARADFCVDCYNKFQRKVERPSRKILKKDIRSKSFRELSKKYGVSDTAIKKWCKSYGLPHKKLEINQISNEDWLKI